MTKTKHTPGPWEYRYSKETDKHYVGSGVCCIIDEAFATIETKDRGKKERQANARLIASAPDLLEALKYARSCIAYCRKNHKDIQSGDGVPVEIFLDAAIAKAEGRS